jgi:hypothetical protein
MRRLLCALLAAAGISQATELTGVLFSDQGGPSGRGTGRVRLFSAGSVREIQYQKPYVQDFSDSNCNEPGAIWGVTVVRAPDGRQQLQRARCEGKVDASVHNAWLLVVRVLGLLGSGTPLPEELFAPSLRGTPRLRSIEATLRSVSAEDYGLFGRAGLCLRIASASGPNGVIVSAADDCFLAVAGKPVAIRFTTSSPRDERGTVFIADIVARE